MFENFSELKKALLLAPVARSTDAWRGEGQSKIWKPTSEFILQDENKSSYDLQILSSWPHGSPLESDDDEIGEEVEYATNVVIGLQAPRKHPTKVMTEEE